MRKKKPNAWYRNKGRYANGRKKVVIEREEAGKIVQKALPNPDKMWCILASLEDGQNSTKLTRENGTV